LTQVVVDQVPVLLVAYDSEYPQPLHAKRPIPDTFRRRHGADAAKTRPVVRESGRGAQRLGVRSIRGPGLGGVALRVSRGPRNLPLLRLLAARTGGTAILEYLDVSRLEVRIEPCA